MSATHYYKTAQDPVWRRALMNLGLDLLDLGYRMHAEVDVRRITIRDHVAWKIEDLGNAIFGLGFNGSQEEECLAINGGMPWIYMSRRQKQACEEFYGTPVPLDQNGYVDNSRKEEL